MQALAVFWKLLLLLEKQREINYDKMLMGVWKALAIGGDFVVIE